jgi:8-oxo-dGTP diphosphatase
MITLAGCVITQNDSILLLKRIKTDWYELPGGKIESGEKPEETAIRELKEEIGCDINIVRKIGEKIFQENDYEMNYVWFKANILKGQEPIVSEPNKFSEVKYIPIAELELQSLSPNMKNFLASLNSNEIKL